MFYILLRFFFAYCGTIYETFENTKFYECMYMFLETVLQVYECKLLICVETLLMVKSTVFSLAMFSSKFENIGLKVSLGNAKE